MELPAFVLAEGEALVARIETAFDGVGREGGVSWSEAEALDRDLSPQEARDAGIKDRETRWQDLVDDPTWNPDPGIGGWPYLDAIGFRYYLPAAMTRIVREEPWSEFVFFLTPEGRLEGGPGGRWTFLDRPQRQCIKRFIGYMAVVESCLTEAHSPNDWSKALRSYWQEIPDEAPSPDR